MLARNLHSEFRCFCCYNKFHALIGIENLAQNNKEVSQKKRKSEETGLPQFRNPFSSVSRFWSSADGAATPSPLPCRRHRGWRLRPYPVAPVRLANDPFGAYTYVAADRRNLMFVQVEVQGQVQN